MNDLALVIGKENRSLRGLTPDQISAVSKRIIARISVTETACHEWRGFKNQSGYGCINVNGKSLLTHRVAYIIDRGENIGSLQLDHLCRNRACCNPAHLEPVTPKENSRRGVKCGPTCSRGHTMQDAYIGKDGRRTCKHCVSISRHKRLAVRRVNAKAAHASMTDEQRAKWRATQKRYRLRRKETGGLPNRPTQ